MNTTHLRHFEDKDTEALIALVRDTWHYDDFCTPKTARRLAKVFLYSCLANQTYTQVALENEQPVGIIMGKDLARYHVPVKYRLRQLAAIAALLTTREGRAVAKTFGHIEAIDQKLLAESPAYYQGELAFFAVSATNRGKGIGKKLFNALLGYMHTQHIGRFFLFTDTSCNYGFYEHQGMTRRGKKDFLFNVGGQREKMEFYLYDYHTAH